MPHASLAIVLHAHLPYVLEGPEQDWLFEAMAESYLPLLDTLERTHRRAPAPLLAVSLSPTLCEMLAAPATPQRFLHYVQQRIDLAQRLARDAHEPLTARACQFHVEFYERARSLHEERYSGGVLEAFAGLADAGQVELLTTAATHAVLPLLATPQGLHAQIAVACANHQKHFGRRPRAFWLPECAYRPGIEDALDKEGIECFVLAPHGLLHGEPRPVHGPYAPVLCPNRVAAFALDTESGKQVWSRTEGYPGDPWYREFYRDAGFDAPHDTVRPLLHNCDARRSLGVRCFRITGGVPLHAKLPYEPDRAFAQARAHAGDFVNRRLAQTRKLASELGVAPIVVMAYDAELFGHWWFEGVAFLQEVLELAGRDTSALQLTTPLSVLDQTDRLQSIQPAESTWGSGGYFAAWVDPANDWIYPPLHAAEERMVELARTFPCASDLTARALAQAARELLLAQSSDWAFMMSQGHTGDYGAERTRLHLRHFSDIAQQVQQREIDSGWLAQVEAGDSLFPEIDYHAWAPF